MFPGQARGRRISIFALCVLGVLGGDSARLTAQFQMPDPKQMAGIPRPVDDLPDGTVSVRVIRGQLSNNIVGQAVELEGGGMTQTATTDENGRAEFRSVAPGTSVRATADVDGERLESHEFPFPGRGGIRLMLVATDPAAASTPAVAGEVSIAEQSRIVIEPGDEAVRVYYLLTVHNSSLSPVNPAGPFTFDMPDGALGTAVLQGSSPQASVIGSRVIVQGPFAPGSTYFEVGCELLVTSGTLEITTRLPARVEQLAVVVRKVGDITLSSASITSQRDLSGQGEAYIAATGGAVPAGQPITLVLSGLPHHSSTPRMIAISLALVIVLAGVWMATHHSAQAGQVRAAERKRLVARREKLFGELVRLETDARNGRVDPDKYGARREHLVSMLELVYGALDESDPASPVDQSAGLRRGQPAPGSEGGAAANA